MLKTRLVLIFVGLLLCQSLCAQSDPPKKPEASKYAEIGSVSRSKMSATMEDLRRYLGPRRELQLYIINYGTPAAIRQRRKLISQSIYWRDGPFDSTRITYVDGKVEPKVRTVMWIVRPGAENPQP